jgi:hypothetical protein
MGTHSGLLEYQKENQLSQVRIANFRLSSFRVDQELSVSFSEYAHRV